MSTVVFGFLVSVPCIIVSLRPGTLFWTHTRLVGHSPAGGCTTTREVLELGQTYRRHPACSFVGRGRWTRGYYHTLLGVNEATRNLLIAESKEGLH